MRRRSLTSDHRSGSNDEAGTRIGTVVELGAGYVIHLIRQRFESDESARISLTKTRHLLRSLSKVLRSPAGFDAIEYKAVSFRFQI